VPPRSPFNVAAGCSDHQEPCNYEGKCNLSCTDTTNVISPAQTLQMQSLLHRHYKCWKNPSETEQNFPFFWANRCRYIY